CLSSSSAERLPNKATVKGDDTPTTLAGCKSVRHKSDENSRAGLPLTLSSYTTGVPASCEDDGCRHPAGSPAPVASPSPNATIGDRTSPCLFHTLEDPIPPQSPRQTAFSCRHSLPRRASAIVAVRVSTPPWETLSLESLSTPSL
ncbi:hypothetical protein PoB_005437300, partial [Plakobranchus ocellatus]